MDAPVWEKMCVGEGGVDGTMLAKDEGLPPDSEQGLWHSFPFLFALNNVCGSGRKRARVGVARGE